VDVLDRLRCRAKRYPIARSLHKLVLRLLHPPPLGLKHFGEGSILRRPRHVDGNGFISIGARTSIQHHAWLSATTDYAGDSFLPEIAIGNDVYIGDYSFIVATNRVIIEDGCVLSNHVYITDSGHGVEPGKGPIMRQKLFSKGEVRIGRETFLGYRVCVMPGVTLGKHCVVGANAVVTKSFPAYSMLAGVPAQLVKRYSLTQKEWIDCKTPVAENES